MPYPIPDLDSWIKKAFCQIHPIYRASRNYGLPESYLVGLIYVECSSLDPKANRFEPSVMESIETVARGKPSQAYPGFNQGAIRQYILRNAENEAMLKPLATSYGVVQIMGYHYLINWGLVPAQFQTVDFQESLHYSTLFVAGELGRANNYEELLRIHNTGRPDGQTYDPEYVEKATTVMEAYREYLKENDLP